MARIFDYCFRTIRSPSPFSFLLTQSSAELWPTCFLNRNSNSLQCRQIRIGICFLESMVQCRCSRICRTMIIVSPRARRRTWTNSILMAKCFGDSRLHETAAAMRRSSFSLGRYTLWQLVADRQHDSGNIIPGFASPPVVKAGTRGNSVDATCDWPAPTSHRPVPPSVQL